MSNARKPGIPTALDDVLNGIDIASDDMFNNLVFDYSTAFTRRLEVNDIANATLASVRDKAVELTWDALQIFVNAQTALKVDEAVSLVLEPSALKMIDGDRKKDRVDS